MLNAKFARQFDIETLTPFWMVDPVEEGVVDPDACYAMRVCVVDLTETITAAVRKAKMDNLRSPG